MRSPLLFVLAAVSALAFSCNEELNSVNVDHPEADIPAAFAKGGLPLAYNVTLLPSIGGSQSAGNGINNSGLIAGTSRPSSNTTTEAALWDGETLIELGTLGGPNSAVLWPGVNNSGTVVGVSETADMDPLGQRFSCWVFFPSFTGHTCRGFAWDSGEMMVMPTLGGFNSFAVMVNDRDQVVGWAETDVDDPTCNTAFQTKQFRGTLWDLRTNQIRELRPLPGDSVSTANVINNRGQIAGISGACGIAVGGVSARAMVFWDNGEQIEMDHLGGVNWHTPMAINNRGDVVGFSNPPDVSDGSFNPHAFFWTGRDGIRDLGTLPGARSSQALGISERGEVVGLSRDADGNDTAVIWSDGTEAGIQNLNDLVAGDFSGHLIYANDVNNRGEITGAALDGVTGDTLAFRAVPTRR